MKYLIVSKPGGQPLPPDQVVDAYKASQAYINKLLDDGTFDCVYGFFKGGGFGVANADSHDEVYKLLLNYPMYSVFIWEVKPILDINKTFETGISTLT
jgi:hypothetical protein